MMCGLACLTPCGCAATFVPAPPPTTTMTPLKFLGMTIRSNVTVQVNVSFMLACV